MAHKNGSERDTNPILNLFREEWSHLGEKRRTFVFYLFLFIIANAIGLLEPLLIGTIFNSIQDSITTGAELRALIFSISLILLISIGFWIFHGIGRYLERRTGFWVRKNFLNSKVRKVLELPVAWHKDHHSGDTIDKINKSSSGVYNFSRNMTFRIVEGVVSLFGSIIVLIFVDLYAAIFALVFSLSTLFIISRFDKRIIEKHKIINKLENKAAAAVYDYLSNIITVVTLKLKKSVRKEVNAKIMASYEEDKHRIKLSESKWAFASIAISFMIVIVLSWKAYSDFNSGGVIMIGTLYILYGYLNKIGRTFYNFAMLYGQIIVSNARVLNAEPIEEEFLKVTKEVKGKLPYDWKNISLKNVDFTYNRAGKELHLDGANINFKKGQKVAFIGESGSGKSTILALMRGLYQPKTGEVYCDGNKIEKGFVDLKEHITLVPQDPEIFNNTILYNITMDIRTRRKDVDAVIDIAQFRKVVNRLEKGINTNVLEKGVSLSGGEKQRLALARGILAGKHSEILLMDEPTSSVDALNESKIYDNLFKKYKGKTVISSLHKLNLLNKFDYIYLFDGGKIVAEGTLKEMKKNSKFKRFSSKFN